MIQEPVWKSASFVRRLKAIQSLCLSMVLVLTFIATGFTAVVWFALDGLALAGQLYTVSGISIVTILTGIVTPFVPLLAMRMSHQLVNSKWLVIAKSHPELVDPATDAQRLGELFAQKTYLEYAIPTGVAFAWAIIYHIVSDSLILGLIGLLMLFVLFRYPTQQRYFYWMEWATSKVSEARSSTQSNSKR